MTYYKLKSEQTSANEFISSWSKCYDEGKYSDEDYEKNLNRKGLIKPDNIQFLFEWKNGNPLSARKQIIADEAKAKVSTLNSFRQLPTVTKTEFDKFWLFACSIIGSGIVYRVFLAHISRPDDYPIVDQHVLRAWNFLTANTVEDPDQTIEVYLKYKHFVLNLTDESGRSLREIDRAMMAFGQFLISQFYPSVLP